MTSNMRNTVVAAFIALIASVGIAVKLTHSGKAADQMIIKAFKVLTLQGATHA